MKELSIEEKAKRYDEAIKIARDSFNYPDYPGFIRADVVFPELKESEDERIRESLLEYLHTLPNHYAHSGVCAPEWIAWLEKRGEYKSPEEVLKIRREMYQIGYNDGYKHGCEDSKKQSESEFKDNKDEKIRKEIINIFHSLADGRIPVPINFADIFTWFEKQGEQKSAKNIVEAWKDMRLEVYQQASGNRHEPNYSDDTTKMFSLNDIDEIIEKMSEQNPADKVDPKDYNSIDPHFGKPAGKVEPKFKVGEWITNGDYTWKIVEVKPLDYILKSQDGNIVDDTISHVDEHFHSFTIQDARDGDVLVSRSPFIYGKQCPYGGLNWCDNKFIKASNFIFTDSPVHPATKEQRDTLIKAMTDAGWEFDFEKKELKKIESINKVEPFDKYEGLTDFERTLADICIGWIGEEIGWKAYIKDNANVLLKIAIKKFNSVQDASFEQKSAWSEEDETKMRTALAFIKSEFPKKGNEEIMEDTIEWLKSLKERYAWKPSEEQMKALHDLNLTGGISYAGQGQVLIELYNDLKKLTE